MTPAPLTSLSGTQLHTFSFSLKPTCLSRNNGPSARMHFPGPLPPWAPISSGPLLPWPLAPLAGGRGLPPLPRAPPVPHHQLAQVSLPARLRVGESQGWDFQC